VGWIDTAIWSVYLLLGHSSEWNCVYSATFDRMIHKPFKLCKLVAYMFQS
jgi:hypothetical protein